MAEPRLPLGAPLGAAVIILATLAAYVPSLRGSYLWDDSTWLWQSHVIRDGKSPLAYWRGEREADYYPLISTSFYVQWQLFGREAVGYRVVNLLLHIASSLLLWRVLRQLRLGEPAAWLGAALFALHPVNVTTAAWISEQKNTLAMVFGLIAMLAHLRYNETGSQRAFVAALLLFAAGLLCKASIVVLPVGLALLIVWRRGVLRRRDLAALLPMLALAVLASAGAVYFQSTRAIGDVGLPVRPEGIASRIAAAGWIVWFYLYKAIVPANLMMVYPRWKVDGGDPVAYLPLAALIAIGVALWRWRSSWLVPAAWFVLALLPVLGLIPMAFHRYSLVADHWTYLALPAVTASVAVAVVRGIRLPLPHLALIVLLPGVCFALTLQRSGVFRHARTLWADNVARNPQAWIAHNNLGNAIALAEPEVALAHFRRAIEIDDQQALPHYNMGYSLAQMGKLDDAIVEFRKSYLLDPGRVSTLRELGKALTQRGAVEEGIAFLREAVRLDPNLPDNQFLLGLALSEAGEVGEAIEHYRQAVAISPTDAEARFNLAKALALVGRREEALGYLQTLVAEYPGDARSRCEMGLLLIEMGRKQEGIAALREARPLAVHDAKLLVRIDAALVRAAP